MRKGLVTAYFLACTLVVAYSADAVPATVSTHAPATATTSSIATTPDIAAPAIAEPAIAAPATAEVAPTRVSAFETEVESVPPSRDRVILQAREPQRSVATPVVADEAAALLQQLVTAERAVRDPAVTGGELAYMGHLQQLVYRRLIERPDLRDAVFAAIPADLRGSADFNLAAGADLWLFGPVRVTELPEWRIVSAAPMNDLLRYYREAEAEFGVSWSYLAAINLVETRMGRIRGDSYAGAQGPMQFMPKTWDAYGDGDVNDPRDAILAAARYLRASGAPADIERAIWHYNHDPEYVDAVMKYAAVMKGDPNAFRGYYGWQVYYQTAYGTYLLPVGWSKD
ncbi:MAG TPA: lytic murein transglycosylase [Candidatus Limnocylindria bacterium]